MSILSALNNAYDRLADRGEVPPFGYSRVEADFCIVIRYDGSPAFEPIDLRTQIGTKSIGPRKNLPTPLIQRTSGIAPNFLWDKTAYSLGITDGSGRRTAKEHAEFISFHKVKLKNCSDEGLSAFRNFITNWKPQLFEELGWPKEMKDKNIVFAFEGDHRKVLLHERPAAKELWQKILEVELADEAVCLVNGTRGRIARSHPPIKGVRGAQSSGAFIVSFNDTAYVSYGHDQGGNAPVSERAAFAYTTVLNKFLEKGSAHRVQIGDASTVFWADGSGAPLAESIFSILTEGPPDKIDEGSEAEKVGAILDKMRAGMPLETFEPDLARGVRFYVLGLAPNAARLSVRFWFEDDFGRLAENYQKFLTDMAIDPPPKDDMPPLWKYLLETAVQHKRENIPPNLAGDWLRAILAGTPYPLTLMSTVLMRLRADKTINALRAALLKAVLIRNFGKKKEAPVALDPENTNKGYLLGRLFAVYEQIQTAALGRNVNATIKDKFYGAASAQPRKVFALLESGSANHLSKVRKQKPGYKVTLERTLGSIMELMSPADDPFPTWLSAEQQALFGLGYYHQHNAFFKSKTDETSIEGGSQ